MIIKYKRKYLKFNSDSKRTYRTSRNSFSTFLMTGLLSVSALIAFVSNQPFTYTGASKNDHFSSTGSNYKAKQGLLETEKFIIAGSTDELKAIDFAKIDEHAFSIRYDGTSVWELASLLSPYAKTEAEKARIIYSWIAHNISYDVPALLSGNYGDLSPQGVLKTRKGVCSGYADLYKSLARAMGLDVTVIEGYSKGYSYVVGSTTSNHAWNSVKINNKWYLIDTTWGAGYVNNSQFNKKFNPYYFATPPEQFIIKHFPVEEKWQLLEKDYSRQQFDTIPEISPEFFKDGLEFITHYDKAIQSNGRFQVVLSAPEDTIVTSKLKANSNYLNDDYTFVQKKDNKIIVTVSPPMGDFDLEIYSKKAYAQGDYHHAIAYKVFSKGAGEELPISYSSYLESNSYLHAPLNKHLPIGQAVYFKIEVPNALEVQVIDTSSNTWTKLTRDGRMFTGNVPVSSAKTQVSAKFPGNGNYWTLVEYN